MNEPQMTSALELRDVSKRFRQGAAELRVLEAVNMTVQKGEVVALVGPSGSGKSTLLHIAGLLEKPTGGEVLIHSKPCGKLGDAARTELRRDTLGFVYQFHHLLPEFSALENVAMPQMIGGTSRKAAELRASSLLEKFGLADRLDHRPAQLSGGEQQRVAIARAVANEPAVLLADEPTGNLDPKTAQQVYGELLSFVREDGLAAIIATHNLSLADDMDRTLSLENGVLKEIG